jgi:hypothetical protein
MDNPHYSSGAGGVIAKFRFCDFDGAWADFSLYLFVCPQRPSQNEAEWQSKYGCVLKASAFYEFYASIQQQYTRYVPPLGQPGQHGTGWWIACAVIIEPFNGLMPSQPVYISA